MQPSDTGTTSPSGSDTMPNESAKTASAISHETRAKRERAAMHASHASSNSSVHIVAANANGSSDSGASAAIAYPGSGAGIVTPGFFSKNIVIPRPVSHERSGSV